MIELLALPAWNAEPRTLEDWTTALEAQGHPAAVHREQDETWLEVTPLQVRGFVVFDGARVEAINFELHAAEPEEAMPVLEAVANQLSWELYPEDVDEDDLDED
jgi:hypothetical protein